MRGSNGHVPGATSSWSIEIVEASQAGCEAVFIDCVYGFAHSSLCAINCAGCNKATQVAGLLHLFKQRGKVQTENNMIAKEVM